MRTARLTLATLLSLTLLPGCRNNQNASSLQQGYSAFEQRRFDQALASADAVIAADASAPDAAAAHYLRGRTLETRPKQNDAESRADLTQARAAYQEALNRSPSEELAAFIHTGLGNASFWLDDFASAERHLREAYQRLARDEMKGRVLYRLASAQQRQGKWADADSTFADVQRLFPGSDAADRARTRAGARAFFVQVAAFQSASTADRLVADLKSKGLPAQRVIKSDANLHLAMVGPFNTFSHAQSARDRLASEHPDSLIVP